MKGETVPSSSDLTPASTARPVQRRGGSWGSSQELRCSRFRGTSHPKDTGDQASHTHMIANKNGKPSTWVSLPKAVICCVLRNQGFRLKLSPRNLCNSYSLHYASPIFHYACSCGDSVFPSSSPITSICTIYTFAYSYITFRPPILLCNTISTFRCGGPG